VPLVVAFHGGGGQAQSLIEQSMFSQVADQNNFIIAYANGTGDPSTTNNTNLAGLTWNDGICCGYAKQNHVDDVAFTKYVINEIESNYSIDPTKVYAVGFSNGADLTHRLACELSDTIAAIAPVSGGMNMGGDFTSCNPVRQVPIFESSEIG